MIHSGEQVEIETLTPEGRRISLHKAMIGGWTGVFDKAFIEYDSPADGFVLNVETWWSDAHYRYSFLIVDGKIVREWGKDLPLEYRVGQWRLGPT